MKPFTQWKKSTKWITGIFLFLVVCFAGGVAYVSWNIYQTADQIYQPVTRLPSQPRQTAKIPEPTQSATDHSAASLPPAPDENKNAPTTAFLLMGIDRWADSRDIGRTDVLMLAILNKSTKQLTLTSIPRDTYVEIAGKGNKDKINAAYRFGVETTIATVENFTGVIIDHYVVFNFDGFVEAIDTMGGIDVDVDANAAKELKLPPGMHHLNGDKALDFVRFRSDARGDFGRNDRQQAVLKEILEQTKELRSPAKIQETLNTVGENVRTDLTLSQIISFAYQLNDLSANGVEQIKYKGNTARFGPQNLSYVLIDEQERQRVSAQLKQIIARK